MKPACDYADVILWLEESMKRIPEVAAGFMVTTRISANGCVHITLIPAHQSTENSSNS